MQKIRKYVGAYWGCVLIYLFFTRQEYVIKTFIFIFLILFLSLEFFDLPSSVFPGVVLPI